MALSQSQDSEEVPQGVGFGAQEAQVLTVMKHFITNNQETNRFSSKTSGSRTGCNKIPNSKPKILTSQAGQLEISASFCELGIKITLTFF